MNAWDDGRGLYFDDPNGHLLEIITRPYGSGGTAVSKPHPLVAAKLNPTDHKARAATSQEKSGGGGRLAVVERSDRRHD
jgi:hypothetical protein